MLVMVDLGAIVEDLEVVDLAAVDSEAVHVLVAAEIEPVRGVVFPVAANKRRVGILTEASAGALEEREATEDLVIVEIGVRAGLAAGDFLGAGGDEFRKYFYFLGIL